MHRGRSCVGNGTLCSKTMAPNGTWRTEPDVRWQPRPSASWFPLLTLRGWPLLKGELAKQSRMRATIQAQRWALIMLCTCSLASQQNGIKQKMAKSKKVLLTRFDELKKSGTGTGTVQAKITSFPSPPCEIRQKSFSTEMTITKKCL